MKKFIISCIIFLVLVAACDFIAGYSLTYLRDHPGSGQSLKNHEIAKVVTPDILILGSSRSVHHFVPSVFEDSLGYPAYIAGQDGNGIVMMYPVLRLVSSRHKPKVVIYDLMEGFDLTDDNLERYIEYLRPLWGENPKVDSVITEVSPSERLKLRSGSYRYNSMELSLLKGFLSSRKEFDHGYSPLYGIMTTRQAELIKPPAKNDRPYSSFKMNLFREMIDFCDDNDIDLYFTVSPYYGMKGGEFGEAVKTITELGGEVWDFSSSPSFSDSIHYFKDSWHLNDHGATVFSDTIVNRIKNEWSIRP